MFAGNSFGDLYKHGQTNFNSHFQNLLNSL